MQFQILRRLGVTAALLCGFGLAGCADTSSGTAGVRSGTNAIQVKDAEANYRLGMARMEDKLFQEAIRYFTFVKDRYPYSKYAALADLRIADAHAAGREFGEAVEQYKRFIRLHPSHEDVPYASFRIGKSYYQQLPSDFFLLPPSYEKDLTSVEQALQALESYKKAFPDDKKHGEDANKLIKDCKLRLGKHELYVAIFYQKKEKWAGMVGRLETMRSLYTGVGLDEEIFGGLSEGYLRLGQNDKACAAFQELRRVAPKSIQYGRLEPLMSSCTTGAATSTAAK
jgi:outer membrane protein assembly factor BamD